MVCVGVRWVIGGIILKVLVVSMMIVLGIGV